MKDIKTKPKMIKSKTLVKNVIKPKDAKNILKKQYILKKAQKLSHGKQDSEDTNNYATETVSNNTFNNVVTTSKQAKIYAVKNYNFAKQKIVKLKARAVVKKEIEKKKLENKGNTPNGNSNNKAINKQDLK